MASETPFPQLALCKIRAGNPTSKVWDPASCRRCWDPWGKAAMWAPEFLLGASPGWGGGCSAIPTWAWNTWRRKVKSLERAKWGKTYCTLWKKVLQEFRKNYSKQGAQEVTCSSEQKYGKRVWKTHRKKSTTRINQKAERAALWVGPFYHISFHSEFGSPVLDKSLLRGVFWGHTQT